MTVKNYKATWETADRFFPTDYIKDEASSQRAGYDVYRTNLNECGWKYKEI